MCVLQNHSGTRARSQKVHEWDDAIAIVPLAPVTGERFLPGEGHVLVIPRVHVSDFAADPVITGRTFQRAAELADLRDSNLITSKGESATQTVHHLHVHLVPRVSRDGLPLPWTPMQHDKIRRLVIDEVLPQFPGEPNQSVPRDSDET